VEDAITILEDRGYFYDDVEGEVEQRFLPLLTQELTKRWQRRIVIVIVIVIDIVIVINNLQTILYTEYDELESRNVSSLEREKLGRIRTRGLSTAERSSA
jgi:hypothetical protein